MIAGLKGLVEEIGPDCLLVNVGGVVFQVHSSSATLSTLSGPGTSVALHTHLQLREEAVTLYGFAARAELRMFLLLLTVTGVGPRIALALLSAMAVDELVAAIGSEDIARLSSVPGVGKRTAARLALELKDRVGQFAPALPIPTSSGAVAQLLAALTSLGYTSSEAALAVRSVPNLPALELEDGLREALRVLSSRG